MIRAQRIVTSAFFSTAIWLGADAPALSDQFDARLPTLFERLHHAGNPLEARVVELKIWQIWNESGAVDLDRLMQEGEAAMALEDFASAESIFSAVIERRPDFAEAWNKRATMFYLAGAYQKSLADIEKVLELEPRHFGALSGLGLVNLALERDPAALDAYQRVLSLYPANDAARHNAEIIAKRLQENDI